MPDKVKGTYITFPNGTKFRRTTGYRRFAIWVEPAAPQVMRGRRIWLGNEVELYGISSNGGPAPGHVIGTNKPYISSSAGSGGQNFPSIPTARRNEAVTRALNKIADQKVGLGEDLGTLGLTLRMLKDPVETLVKSLTKVYRDRSMHKFLRMPIKAFYKKGLVTPAAERYLEYVYGWKPLVSDIYGLIDLAKSKAVKPLILGASSSSRSVDDLPVYKSIDTSHGIVTNIGPIKTKSRVRCNLYARLDPNHAGLRSLNQLGLLNPISLAWELASFSFVVDWLLPIGPVLNALSAPAGLLFVNGSLSNRISQSGPYEQWWNGNDDYATGTHGSGTARYEGYYRQELTTWPLPGFWFDSDPFRGDRIFKALALSIASTRSFRF